MLDIASSTPVVRGHGDEKEERGERKTAQQHRQRHWVTGGPQVDSVTLHVRLRDLRV
jgi:hypothetical protein